MDKTKVGGSGKGGGDVWGWGEMQTTILEQEF